MKGYGVHIATERGKLMVCHECGAKNDAHSNLGEAPAVPEPGDICICAYCATPGAYTEDGTRPLTYDEWSECMANEGFRLAYDGLRQIVAEKKRSES